jgi:hypothetical protein
MRAKLRDKVRLIEIVKELPRAKGTSAERIIINKIVKTYFKYVKMAVLEGYVIEIPHLGNIYIKRFVQTGKRKVFNRITKKLEDSPLFIPHRLGWAYKICIEGNTVGRAGRGLWFQANQGFQKAMNNILKNTYKEYRTTTYEADQC